MSYAVKTPATPEQCSQGDPTAPQKNAERRGARRTFANINALSSTVNAVGLHKTPNNGAHFDHAQNKLSYK